MKAVSDTKRAGSSRVRVRPQRRKSESSAQTLTALSLFSGGGGIDLGFSAAGFNVACSSDIDPFSCNTLLINSGKKRFYKHAHSIPADIRKLAASDLLRKAELEKKSIQIVLGGPPCQAFSVFGRRKGLKDPRGDLVWEYLRIIREVQPEAFVFENVAGLKSIHGGTLYQKILAQLALGGRYTVSAHNYEMADFGNSAVPRPDFLHRFQKRNLSPCNGAYARVFPTCKESVPKRQRRVAQSA